SRERRPRESHCRHDGRWPRLPATVLRGAAQSCDRSQPGKLVFDVEHSGFVQDLEHLLSGFLRRELLGPQVNLWTLRWLVRRIDAREVLELATPRLLVQPFRIAPFRLFERRVDEHLEELAWLEQLAGEAPFRAEGRDERDEHDQAGIDHQLRNF